MSLCSRLRRFEGFLLFIFGGSTGWRNDGFAGGDVLFNFASSCGRCRFLDFVMIDIG